MYQLSGSVGWGVAAVAGRRGGGGWRWQGIYLLLERLKYASYRRLLKRIQLLHAEGNPAKAFQLPLGTPTCPTTPQMLCRHAPGAVRYATAASFPCWPGASRS